MAESSPDKLRVYRCSIFRSSLFGGQESVCVAASSPEGLTVLDTNLETQIRLTSFGAMGRIAVSCDNVLVFTGRQQTGPQTFPDGTDVSTLDRNGIVGIPFVNDDPRKNHGPRCVRFTKLTKGREEPDDLAELCFKTNVCGLKANSTGLLAVVLETKTLIYDVRDVLLKSEKQRKEEEEKHIRRRRQTKVDPIMTINTGLNFRGVVAMTNPKNGEDVLVAVPGPGVGQVCIANITRKVCSYHSVMKHQLCAAEFSPDGKRLFVISELGKYCYIVDVEGGVMFHYLVRGSTAAIPFSPCVSDDGEFVLTSSQKGTLHLYHLNEEELKEKLKEKLPSKDTTEGATKVQPVTPAAERKQGKTLEDLAVDEGGDEEESEGSSEGSDESDEEGPIRGHQGTPAQEDTGGSGGFVGWLGNTWNRTYELGKKLLKITVEIITKNGNAEIKKCVTPGSCISCAFGPQNDIFIVSSEGIALKFNLVAGKPEQNKVVHLSGTV